MQHIKGMLTKLKQKIEELRSTELFLTLLETQFYSKAELPQIRIHRDPNAHTQNKTGVT